MMEPVPAKACEWHLRNDHAKPVGATVTTEAYSAWRAQTPQRILCLRRSTRDPRPPRARLPLPRGDLAQAIAQSGAGSVVVIVLSPESITDAGARLDSGELSGRVTFIEGQPKSIPLSDASIDTISCFDAMEQ